MTLVVDTGVLYAHLDRTDPHHAACQRILLDTTEQRVVPVPVLVELDYLLRRRASVRFWFDFCQDVEAGAYLIFALDADLLRTTATLQSKYADLPLGLVDAAVFATCEALKERKVATLDRRHFSVLRTSDGRALELLPHSR